MKSGIDGVMGEWRQMQERIEALQTENAELREALSAFVDWYDKNKPLPYEESGIQMIAYYAKKALAKASGEEAK